MITITNKATEPEKIKFSLTITMTLAEWKKLKDDVNSLEAISLRNAIRCLISKAQDEYSDAVITETDEEKKEESR